MSYNLGSPLRTYWELSTDHFTIGLRRYISGRGYPLEIFSDNGTNFISGERELHKAISELDQNKIYKELVTKRIKWNFSPLASPKMNEAMEAIVKITSAENCCTRLVIYRRNVSNIFN